MYEDFFGLRKKPFELVPNPDFLYLSRTHKKVGIYLDYAMRENTGFILLTGEVGSGKTTIIRSLLKKLGPDVQVSKVFNTRLSSEELLATVNDDFGLHIDGRNKVQLLKELYQFLIEQYGLKRRSVVIIDEAQNLSVDALEELRMLSNLETNDTKLLQIILVGQPELKRILSVSELRQLRQRISIHCHLQPLGPAETIEYVLHRLEIAGNREAVRFADQALELVHGYCGGIPRLINIMCDFLLLSAYAEGSRVISEELVREVAGDPQFEGQFLPAPPNRPAPVAPPVERPVRGRPEAGPEVPAPSQDRIPDEPYEADPVPSVPPLELTDPIDASEPVEPAPAQASALPDPARPAVGKAPSGREKKALRPEEIEDLSRRLDLFEASVKEICQQVGAGETVPPPREETGNDLILNMPKFDYPAGKRGGLMSGFRRIFFKSLLP